MELAIWLQTERNTRRTEILSKTRWMRLDNASLFDESSHEFLIAAIECRRCNHKSLAQLLFEIVTYFYGYVLVGWLRNYVCSEELVPMVVLD
jgi:hypothetical protein